MSREWKPGDVATDGVFAVLRSARGGFAYADGSFVADEACGVLTYRPLVVLDPEDMSQVERLADALTANEDPRTNTASVNRINALQAALRSLIAPPKPPEPQGLGAVVEDTEGERWVRWEIVERHPMPWCVAGAVKPNRAYDGIDAVKILSEGVS